ncbi:MAG: membrane protein [Psychromonas sp.]|jgi:membrane protein|uniref:YihY/virulence factor BrkB family protein n=1 Tax=Psychromonas sp. TaxID=1884585 RepID=UPI0039E42FDE
MKSFITKIINFIETDIWRIRANQLSGVKLFALRQLRIILLAVRGFAEDKCMLRASALTFFSLLSMVPVAAMAFGIAKGFGFDKKLETLLFNNLQGQEEVVEKLIGFSQAMLENTQGGVIAGIGTVVLFWTVIKVLGQIEESFNEIWGIKKSRSLGRKFSDYVSIMLICPVLLILSSSATVIITSQVTLLVEKISFLGPIVPLIIISLKILPYAVIWTVFTFIYIFIPNTKVNFQAGLLGGIIAGTIYQIVQLVYITFQVGVLKYGAIYGSFAALPLFLVWLQMSWLIVLLGAEVSFAEQNVETYEFEPDCLKTSHSFKLLISLYIVQLSVKNFCKGEKPWHADQISHFLELPIRLVRQILFELTEAGLLVEVKLNDADTLFYQPARDPEFLTIFNVMEVLDQDGIDAVPMINSDEFNKLKETFEKFKASIEKSPSNIALKDI